MNCMNCGSTHIAPVKTSSGDRYLLTEIDTKSNSVNVGNGLVVDVIACTNCGFLHLINEDFKNAEISK